jgi:hypothetical protein
MTSIAHHPRCVRIWLVLLAPALLTGCGDGRPRRVPVSGRVLIDGQPLTSGYVRLIPPDERAATGRIDENGRFRLTTFEGEDGCVTGTHAVEVSCYDERNPREIRWLIPKKYVHYKTSGIEKTIDGPTDDLLIELTWEGEEPETEQRISAGDEDPAATGF